MDSRDSSSSTAVAKSVGDSLPPLAYLERNQRRGSITDPSLHSSTPPPNRIHDQDQSPRNRQHVPSPHAVRPVSPYTFGSATVVHSEPNQHFRRVLRSPDLESSAQHRSVSGPPENGSPTDEPRTWGSFESSDRRSKVGDDRDVDVDMHGQRSSHLGVHADNDQFDYTMRRHSIAVVHPGGARIPSPSDRLRRHELHRSPFGPAASQTLKRKMSHDRVVFGTLGEEGDTNAMAVDGEEPAPKRRGSAVDTRIAQLSLNDRRDSLDSRSPVSSHLWQDRRDSTSSMLSMSSFGGYGSSDSHQKGVGPFSWGNAGQDGHNEAQSRRPFETRGGNTPGDLQHLAPDSRPMPLPSIQAYPPDRRMSVPEATPKMPDRPLRARSRPPSSRGGASPDPESHERHNKSQSGPDQSQSAGESPPPDAGSPGGTLHAGSSTTPYSRSPELRVSHKLAERKRRKEMKELFDELRDHLPADRGMKASKWEILSKAVDHIQTLKNIQHEQQREIDMLRHENDALRAQAGQFAPPAVSHQGVAYTQPPIAPYPPGAPVVSSQRGSVSHSYGGSGSAQARGASPM